MSSVYQNLLNKYLDDGARAAKFECIIAAPVFNSEDEEMISTLVKSTSFPGKSIEPLDITFKGRKIPIRGQVKYDQTWDCTFYLTEDHNLKGQFEAWIEALNEVHTYKADDLYLRHESSLKYKISQRNNQWFGIAVVRQLDFEMGNYRRSYVLNNIFPLSVKSVETNYESIGQVSEFTVTFAFSHYDMDDIKGEDLTIAEQLAALGKGAVEVATGALSDALSSIGDNLVGEGTGSPTETKSTIAITDFRIGFFDESDDDEIYGEGTD